MNGLEGFLGKLQEFDINGVNIYSMLTDPVVSTAVILSCLFFLMVIILHSDKRQTKIDYNFRVRNIKLNYKEGFEKEKEKFEKEKAALKEDCEKTVQIKENYIRMFFSYRILAPYRSVLEKHPRFVGFDMLGRAALIPKPDEADYAELLSAEEQYYDLYGSYLPENDLDKVADIARNIWDTISAFAPDGFRYERLADEWCCHTIADAEESVRNILSNAFTEHWVDCDVLIYLDNILDYKKKPRNYLGWEWPYGRILIAPLKEEFAGDMVLEEKVMYIKAVLRKIHDRYNNRPQVDGYRVDDDKKDDDWEPFHTSSYSSSSYDSGPFGIQSIWERNNELFAQDALDRHKAMEDAWARGEDWKSLY